MKRQVTALFLAGACLVGSSVAHADPDGTGTGTEEGITAKSEVRPNEVALDLSEVRSRVVDRENIVGVRYENVDGDWALGIEPRGGFGFQDRGNTEMTIASVGLDATADRRFRIGRVVTIIVGGGAGAEYIWQRDEVLGSATSMTSHALAVGPIVFGGARFSIREDSWLQLGARGGVELMNVDGSFGPVATVGVTGSWGVSF